MSEHLPKSQRRLESKKRKAAAFLRLLKSEVDTECLSEKRTSDSSMEPPNKKPRLDVPSNETTGNLDKQSKIEDIQEVKRYLKARQKLSMQRPKVFLTMDELTRDFPGLPDEGIKQRPPLYMLDVQHLILYAMMLEQASFKPRWCRLVRASKVTKVVVVVLEGVSAQDFQSFPDSLPTLKKAFDISVNLISPVQYGSTVQEDLLKVPLSISQMKQKGLLNKSHGVVSVDKAESLSYTVENLEPNSKVKAHGVVSVDKAESLSYTVENLEPNSKVKAHGVVSVDKAESLSYTVENLEPNSKVKVKESNAGLPELDKKSDNDLPGHDAFPRTLLLLNTAQMMREGYPMPIEDRLEKYKDFKFSCDNYAPVGIRSPILAVDCEMCLTVIGKNELTRVSVINENLETVYDTLVKPYNRIRDYLTRFSGITKQLLDPVNTRLEDVQSALKKILTPDTILCGQSLNGDLLAIKIFHPYVIDTSVIYNLSGKRWMKSGLKKLTAHFLAQSIQDSPDGHSSVEDAKATMELVLLKLSKGIHFGDSINGGPQAILAIQEGDVQQTELMNSVKTHHSSFDNSTREKCQTGDGKDKTYQTTNDKPGLKCIKDSGQNAEKCKIASIPSLLCAKGLQKQNNQDLKYKKREKFLQMSQDMKNRNVFFHRGYITHSIMDAIKDVKKTGVVIDEEDSLPILENSNQENTLIAESDILRMRLARSSLTEKDFIYVTFHGYRDYLQDSVGQKVDLEERKKHLQELDRMTWKILKQAPQKSVFTVVLSGRDEIHQVEEAMALVKIT